MKSIQDGKTVVVLPIPPTMRGVTKVPHVIPYQGSKRKLAPTIAAYFPGDRGSKKKSPNNLMKKSEATYAQELFAIFESKDGFDRNRAEYQSVSNPEIAQLGYPASAPIRFLAKSIRAFAIFT